MKTKLNDLKNELIAWLNDECPACFPPLTPYTTADLSHGFTEGLRIRLDEITICRGRILEQTEVAMEETYKKELQVKIGKILDENLQLDMPRPVRAKMNVVRKMMEILPLESVPVADNRIMELLNKYTTTSLSWMKDTHQNFVIDPMDYHKIAEEFFKSIK
jgi:hypothetical protein